VSIDHVACGTWSKSLPSQIRVWCHSLDQEERHFTATDTHSRTSLVVSCMWHVHSL